jgi:predicted nucleotidyltransferase
MSKRPDKLINDFKQAMKDIYSDRLDKVILYGSYARGDSTEDSDIDFLVVLKDKQISASQEINRVGDVLWSLWDRSLINIHFLPMTAERFYHAKSPLLYWVRKEGKEI